MRAADEPHRHPEFAAAAAAGPAARDATPTPESDTTKAAPMSRAVTAFPVRATGRKPRGIRPLSPPIFDLAVIRMRCNVGDTLKIDACLFMSEAACAQKRRNER